ncbi:AEC family transporter [Halomonas sp. YLGW01]|uniref:AEC family transporter n=1 Tax=Halomonas sp. YLGW01 TaxID=2773308 RepID=UPI001781BA53|nr:AEC family transporter [Halomonas sp. YLGW01]
MNLLAVFQHTLNVTLPVFAMVFIGIGLKRGGWIDPAFVSTASALVFKATMPTLVFMSIVQADLETSLNPSMLGYFALATLASFALAWAWAHFRVGRADRGVYIQGAFRGNCAIVGLALAASMYGDYGLSAGGLLLGVVIISYNALSVVALTTFQDGQATNWRSILGQVARNPLILAVVAALPVALSDVALPAWLLTTGDYFASLTLPLALICVGATLSVKALRNDSTTATSASLMKMVVLPILATAGAWLAGFSGRELGVMFLFFSSPTAAASFVMVKAMNGNARLAANIIAISTLLASLTVTGGVFGLRVAGLI